MSSVIAFSYWLEEHTRWVAHISGVLLIIIIASILGNSGLVPASDNAYGMHIKSIMLLGIVLMLFAFNPINILRVNKDFIFCFFIGAVSTTIGGLIAGLIFKTILPEDYWRISAQFTASFIGGYENAVSVSSALNTPIDVFLKTFAGDSVLTTFWIIINIFQGRNIKTTSANVNLQDSNMENIASPVDVASLAITVTMALAIFGISTYIHAYLPNIPEIVIASVLATLITFTPLRLRFSSSYIIGSFGLSYFIFVCGAITNISSLFNSSIILILFPATIVLIHAIILFSVAKLFKIKKEIVIITSQSLIGGPATALAVVSSRKWNYQFEAITLGLLGYALGNYFGFAAAWILK